MAHVLAERGELTYDTVIAEVWPEFAAHGKGTATVRHALTHSLGVPGVPPDTTPEDVCDWDRYALPSPTLNCGGSRARRSATTPTPSGSSSVRSSGGSPAG